MSQVQSATYFQEVCEATADALARIGAHITAAAVADLFEFPGRKDFGDSAMPCFVLSRELKIPPPKIAAALQENFQSPSSVVRTAAVGGYFNVWYEPSAIAGEVLPAIAEGGARYGDSIEGVGRTICMDYSHPNIAKPFGVGHLRSTVIGNSLIRTFEKLGYTTRGINHLGDWGTQFGRLIVAYRNWGDESALEQEPIKHLYDLYVRFHAEAETNKSLEDRGRAEFKKLEDGDPENRRLWQHFRDLSLSEFQRVYRRLGVTFDSYDGEAFFEPKLTPLIARLEESGVAQLGDDGALVIPMDGADEPPLLIRKGDGATLYATRDIAAAEYRHDTYDFDKCLYIVGSAQALHFKQLFAALRKMGYDWASRMVHVEFGWVKLGDTMMSTRKGNIVFLDQVLSDAVSFIRRVIAERNPELADPDQVAEQVGVGAVVFWMLGVKRQKDVNFDWEDVLSFDGRTGPYVQYTHARVCSLIAKWGKPVPAQGECEFGTLSTDEERHLLLQLADWPRKIRIAAKQYEPQVISAALLDMAQAYNKFYQTVRILDGEPGAVTARILLADCFRQVLSEGLRLLGLAAPERM